MKPKKNLDQASSRSGWLRTRWGIAVAVGGVVGAFLLNINAVLSNVRNLPGEIGKTSDQFLSWYYEDSEWSGYWTNNPQAYADAADMNLSPQKFAIDIAVENGEIDGTIATPQVCATFPFFDFILLRGSVNTFGDSATVIAFDLFGGHSRDIAQLELQRDGAVISVRPTEGAVQLFPTSARVARDPLIDSAPAFCEGRQEAIARIIEQAMRSQRSSQ